MKYYSQHLQAFLHAQSLGVVINIDDVLPHALGGLAALGLGVLDLGGAEEAAVLREVPVLVRLGRVFHPPGAEVVAVVVGELLVWGDNTTMRLYLLTLTSLLTGGHPVYEVVSGLLRDVHDHVLAQPPVGPQQPRDLLARGQIICTMLHGLVFSLALTWGTA